MQLQPGLFTINCHLFLGEEVLLSSLADRETLIAPGSPLLSSVTSLVWVRIARIFLAAWRLQESFTRIYCVIRYLPHIHIAEISRFRDGDVTLVANFEPLTLSPLCLIVFPWTQDDRNRMMYIYIYINGRPSGWSPSSPMGRHVKLKVH